MHPPPNFFAPKPAIKPLNKVFIKLIVRILFYFNKALIFKANTANRLNNNQF